MEEKQYKRKLTVLIGNYLEQYNIPRNKFMTYNFLQCMSYFIEVCKCPLYDAFLRAITHDLPQNNFQKQPLSMQLRFMLHYFDLADYIADFPADIICQMQEDCPRPRILRYISVLTDNVLITVVERLGMYFSLCDMEQLMKRRLNTHMMSNDQLLALQAAASRFASVLVEEKLAGLGESREFDEAQMELERLSRACLLRGIQPYSIAALYSKTRKAAHLKYAQSFDYDQFKEYFLADNAEFPSQRSKNCDEDIEEAFLEKLKRGVTNISENLCLFRQIHYFLTIYDFKFSSSMYEIEELLKHEPFRHVMEAYNGFQVSRYNIIIDFASFIAAHSANLSHADFFLRQDLKIKFKGERGADGGGLRREFLYNIVCEFFKPEFGVFKQYENGMVWVNNFYPLKSDKLYKPMRLFGTALGMCILNSVCIENRLPLAFFKIICRHDKLALMDAPGAGGFFPRPAVVDLESAADEVFPGCLRVHPCVVPERIEDLYKLAYVDVQELDDELYTRVEGLLDLESEGIDVKELEMCFCADGDVFGAHKSINLVPNGQNVRVTNENLREFVDRRLSFELAWQTRALEEARAGFQQIIPQFKLECATPSQVRSILCGAQVIDFAALRAVTRYGKPYNPGHTVIKMFWEVLNEFTQSQKEDFLTFVFCSPRIPVSGFPDFLIEREGDTNAFPCAHTCVRSLSLPPYTSRAQMSAKIEFAIQYKTGFGVI